MEDIKILEELIKYWNDIINETDEDSPAYNWIKDEKIEERKNALEHLINRNKKLEKEMNEELRKPKYIIDFKTNEIMKLTNNFINKDKIKEKIKQLEKEQEQNRKELSRGIDFLSNKMIDSAANKIVINYSIREYFQELLEEGE